MEMGQQAWRIDPESGPVTRVTDELCTNGQLEGVGEPALRNKPR